MATVGTTYVKIDYEGTDISEDISKYLTSFSYTDNVHGKADECEITLDDRDGLFANSWYPDKKSKVTCEIIHESISLYCGTFFIGEVGLSGPPDIFTWHCTSIDPNSTLRTKKSKGYNKVTLLKIAQDIASTHSLTVDDGTKTITLKNKPTDSEQAQLLKLSNLFTQKSSEPNVTFFYTLISNLILETKKVIASLNADGYSDEADELSQLITDNLTAKDADVTTDVKNKRIGSVKVANGIKKVISELKAEPLTRTQTLGLGLANIKIERSTQNNETDLFYLAQLSKKYGLAFNIKPPYLVFYSVFQLEDAPSVVTVDKTSCTGFNLNDKISDTYSDVKVSSHNPNTNETITNTATLQNTVSEQTTLLSLAGFIAQAALQPNYNGRLTFIRKAHENNDLVLTGLSKKGFGEEYESLLAAYSLLYADRSVEACVRYSNFCKTLRTKLLKIQASGNKVSKDKDAYEGGQSANFLTVHGKVETTEQADAIGKAALHDKNSKTRTGSFSAPGNLLLVAGSNFYFTGLGRLSGKYNILTSTHTVSDGYTTNVEFKQGAITIKTSKKGKVTVK